MAKLKVLFVCVHNSARSLMAESSLKRWGGDDFEVSSAGLSPGSANPLVVEVMKDWGVDLSHRKGQSVFELYKAGRLYDFVISVCDESSAERCPVFPGITQRIHWSFEDPAAFEGTWEEKLERTRSLRDQISRTVQDWVEDIRSRMAS
ncbi:MAG: arsenate reductase ArsC [Syntrophobacteraceae bacterium]|jgi:arsenate reductase|nr:arsenate reductase ArsC [Syntrophobacteraceae bacterium]